MRHLLLAAALAPFIAAPVAAESWTLDSETSRIAFGSIKNAYVGEVHTFETLTGSVSSDGTAEIAIDLASVETLIDIRNERMIEHVFKGVPAAQITAALDLSAAQELAVGDMMTTEVDATLSFLGTEVDLYADMLVVRLTEDRVMALSNDMAFLETDSIGIDAGIDVLQGLASLDSIARAVPLTVRFVFDADKTGL
ncbi:MAG: YceI family protein [Pseudomonadota bacterium]